MSIYYTDVVQIRSVQRDKTFGTEEKDNSFLSNAYVEEESEIKYNKNGELIDPVIHIFLPVTIAILKGDYIKVISLHGNEVNVHDGIERKVKRVSHVGGFNDSHLEVLV